MILDVRVLGDPILREETKPVAYVTDDIRKLADDMLDTMYAAGGIGLAAPQIGRTERMFVMDVDGTQYVLINPEITEKSGGERGEEGCLSIPDIFGEVDRSYQVTVRALDRDGNSIQLQASDLLARCIQHEVDHLDGKLFIDYLSVFKRKAALAEWDEEKTKYPGYIRRIDPNNPHSRERQSEAHEVGINEVGINEVGREPEL
jgi:peptide deformylase